MLLEILRTVLELAAGGGGVAFLMRRSVRLRDAAAQAAALERAHEAQLAAHEERLRVQALHDGSAPRDERHRYYKSKLIERKQLEELVIALRAQLGPAPKVK